MRVGIAQPTYLGWAGLFDMIDQCDLWVFLDTVEVSKQSWQTRNRILTRDDQQQWLSIPVSSNGTTPIHDVRLADEHPWRRKHRRTLGQCYGWCDHARTLDGLIVHITDWPTLGTLNRATTIYLARTLGIQTRFSRASALATTRTDRGGRIADLLHQTKATEWLEAAGGRGIFPDRLEGVPVRFHQYEPVEYRQNRRHQFVPYLSVVDCLARHGAKRTLELIRAGRNT